MKYFAVMSKIDCPTQFRVRDRHFGVWTLQVLHEKSVYRMRKEGKEAGEGEGRRGGRERGRERVKPLKGFPLPCSLL